MIGYNSKRLPQLTKNFRVTELELTGLLVNIHGFVQLLCNGYFEVLVNHKAIEYMINPFDTFHVGPTWYESLPMYDPCQSDMVYPRCHVCCLYCNESLI